MKYCVYGHSMEQLSLASNSASSPSISMHSNGSYIMPGAESMEVPKTYSPTYRILLGETIHQRSWAFLHVLDGRVKNMGPWRLSTWGSKPPWELGNISPRQTSGLLPITVRAVNLLSLVFLSCNIVHSMCYGPSTMPSLKSPSGMERARGTSANEHRASATPFAKNHQGLGLWSRSVRSSATIHGTVIG